jgi:5-methyltetrahydropteroyltriglutamate--homocysteine methyltransferase
MKRSSQRILTTHVGSLVRPPQILEGILSQVAGRPFDQAKFEAQLKSAVRDVVHKQAEIGIDIPSDGEFSKPSFHGYITERLGGLEQIAAEKRPAEAGAMYSMLREQFPGFMQQYNNMYRTMWLPPSLPRDLVDAAINTPVERSRVVGPITYKGTAQLTRDLDNYKAALAGCPFAEAFVPAATPARSDADPGNVYKSEEEYLYALAEAMHVEYKAIVDAGFVVQLDLGLPARNQVLPGNPHPTPEQLRRVSQIQVEAYNYALRGIPQERVRYHLCWGSMNTPHTTDIPLREFLDLILQINAQAYAIEAANPRHEHEWKVWQEVKLPADKILIPGVVSHSTNVVEHPELIAARIRNFASVVGRENVIAGTDCGFSQGWDMIRVHPEVQWAKLRSLVEGAALASRDLWS